MAVPIVVRCLLFMRGPRSGSLRESEGRLDCECDIDGAADAPAARLSRSGQADENGTLLNAPDVDEDIGMSTLKNLRMHGPPKCRCFAILG